MLSEGYERMTISELCERIQVCVRARQWPEVRRLYEHVVCARYGELPVLERDRLHTLVQPAFQQMSPDVTFVVVSTPQPVVAPSRARIGADPAVMRPSMNSRKAAPKIRKTYEDEPVTSVSQELWRNLWNEFKQASSCLLPLAVWEGVCRNGWLQNRFESLQRVSSRMRHRRVALFLGEITTAGVVSGEVVYAICTVFYAYGIVTRRENMDFIRRFGMVAGRSPGFGDDDE